jgi:hypothetical protein
MKVRRSAEAVQAWCRALRREMGYPVATVNDQIAFSGGSLKDMAGVRHITRLAEGIDRDTVFVVFSEPFDAGPVELSLAVRQSASVEWHEKVLPYAAAMDAPIQLLTETHLWSVGPRNVFTAAPLPPGSTVVKGVQRAARRGRNAVETMEAVTLT